MKVADQNFARSETELRISYSSGRVIDKDNGKLLSKGDGKAMHKLMEICIFSSQYVEKKAIPPETMDLFNLLTLAGHTKDILNHNI